MRKRENWWRADMVDQFAEGLRLRVIELEGHMRPFLQELVKMMSDFPEVLDETSIDVGQS